ncbi:hypothetical protein Q7C36_004597 [Tachysurus vachellii]|uniref:HSF-type DNA-binding domain-containing protein n=1 Tax=Tachysurus vachellii TaxID=175792 RepID=A0AA88T2W6_TACVA|nr:hypothetical protein Q7C36_004597 [Tachysurus vachellii]
MEDNRRNFPSKLWHLVNDPQICSICWDDSGEGILICQEAFKAELLSTAKKKVNKYFKTKDFISFVRQLNLYGFRKVSPDYEISEKQVSTMHHFSNPNFKRANPELLVNLKRLTPSKKAKLAAGPAVVGQYMDRTNYNSFFHLYIHSSLHQGTPHLYSQRGKWSDTTPQTSQAFVTDHGDSSSEFCHFQMDFPWEHPSSQMQQGSHYAVPDGNLEYQCYMPGSLDSNMRCSQQDVASYTHRGFDPDSSVSYVHCTGQDPNWQSADDPDPRKSYMNPDTVFKVENEMKAADFISFETTNEKSPVKAVKYQSHL